jgi:type 1 fimbria pilin
VSLIKLILFISVFHVTTVFSAIINCEPATAGLNIGMHKDEWSTIHSAFELKPSGVNITLGQNISDWSVLYSFNGLTLGQLTGTCTGGTPWINYVFYYPQHAMPAGTVSGSVIYPTDVPGIGISIDDGSGLHYQVYPWYQGDVGAYNGDADFIIPGEVKLWKIPGKLPVTSGSVNITGPEVGVVYSNIAGGYTMASQSPGRIVNFAGGTGYLAGSRILHATLMIQPGTCNIEGDDVKVDMGVYDGSDGHSVWKDARFKLVCPDGMGYNGSATSDYVVNAPYSIDPNATIAPNNMKNGRVQISIVPYTEVLDANKGILALDGTGAKGYGIQLAWGDYSNQNNAEPATPVILNTYVAANSLNSAFLAGDTPLGGNGFSGEDNSIKMAARYVRTTGETAPGPANAIVQVVANYQ